LRARIPGGSIVGGGEMKLLILGGTMFLGRHIAEAALRRGHSLTLFNRGRHNPELFPDVEKLRGHRDGELDALRGRRWDAVIDTGVQVPRVVSESASLLAPAVEHYTFISSLWAYRDFPDCPGLDEGMPLRKLDEPHPERITAETFGPIKASGEAAVSAAMPGRALILRPGLIVGPYDPTGRFAYWPRRVAEGGNVLAPGGPEFRVQLIDARDLAAWIVDLLESGRVGTFNATGPVEPLTMGGLLEDCRSVTGGDARFTWIDDEEFLLQAGITLELSPWIPKAPGVAAVDCSSAVAAGLTFRPPTDTIRDVMSWDMSLPAPARRGGINREREADLLQAWNATRGRQTPQLYPAGGGTRG